jgi:hypothetical protein
MYTTKNLHCPEKEIAFIMDPSVCTCTLNYWCNVYSIPNYHNLCGLISVDKYYQASSAGADSV